MRVALIYTRLDVLAWDVTMNLCVLKDKHNIMQEVKVIEAHIVTQVRYAQSFRCVVNKLFSKCTSWCLLEFGLVWHVTELAK